jgi:hypothetical protein
LSVRSLIFFALMLAAVMGAGLVVQPPPVRASNAPDQFDATAAFARIERVLSPEQPHPMDSAGADLVRARLLAEITALGYAPEVHEHFDCRPQQRAPAIDCGRVRNIVFSAGPASGPAVLAAAHYDSVPAGPGASDDGVGMAAWLEIARLVRDAPLTRRVIFLISDGEEPALLGAYAFERSDPLMDDVQAIVNLEARGTRGPAIFFETNQPNGDAIGAYAAGARRPLANSIMADVYAVLPNTTDVTVLRRPNVDVVNIALLDGWEDYHTPQDNLASFDQRSLQHMGDAALPTLLHLAGAADTGSTERLVFTDIATRSFVALSGWLALSVLGVSVLVAAVAFWRGGREARWRTFALPLVAIVLAVALASAVGFAFGFLRPGDYWFAYPLATRAWCALLAFTGIALAFLWLGRGARAAHMDAAAMFWFGALGFAGSLALSGLSVLFVFSSFVFALGAIGALLQPAAAPLAAAVAGLIALVLWAPILHLLEVALGYQMPGVFVAFAALMLLPWLGMLARLQGEARWRWPALALGAAALGCVALAAVLPAETPQRPRPLNVVYLQDATTDQSFFLAGAVGRPAPPELARLADFEPRLAVPGDRTESWSAIAPNAHLPTPRVAILSDQTEGETRRVRLSLQTNGAYRTIIRIPRTDEPVRASVSGVENAFSDVSDFGDFVSLSCIGRACDGAEASIEAGAGANPERWLVIGQFLDAPDVTAPLRAARPPHVTPIQNGDTALTLSYLAAGATPAANLP